jgi:hypothetical protein
MHISSVQEHLGAQLRRLCAALRMDAENPISLLDELLGPHGARPLTQPPAWPSGVADDNSPIEFSVAYNETGPPALRILAEVLGAAPGVPDNLAATYEFLDRQTVRHGLHLGRLDAVRDLFEPAVPEAVFALWCSLVFRTGHPPDLNV